MARCHGPTGRQRPLGIAGSLAVRKMVASFALVNGERIKCHFTWEALFESGHLPRARNG